MPLKGTRLFGAVLKVRYFFGFGGFAYFPRKAHPLALRYRAEPSSAFLAR
jgi:hypothetical protein